jgi:membrane protease subunit HflK
MPYPFQSHELVNLSQVRTIEIGYRNNVKTRVLRESLMLTDDENIVDLQFAVQYILKDPEDYLFNVRRPDEVVMLVAESAFREAVGRSSMDFVLYEGREQIAASAQKLMQDILDKYQTGIAISRVNVQNAQPPEQVQAAFDDAVKAKQDQERQKNEGQAYFNDVVPRARGAAQRLIEEANGYRQRVVANAEGETARFRSVLAEYTRAPQITRERIYIETLQQVLTSSTKILVDAKSNGNLLFLPLDRIMAMTGSGGEGAAALKPLAPESTQAPDAAAGRSRDSLRAREREGRP